MDRTYQTEFPRFELDVEIPAGFIDESWSQDACPSWVHPELKLKLYIDYQNFLDSEARSWNITEKDYTRFVMHGIDEDGIPKDFDIRAMTNDWNDVLKAIKEAENDKKNTP